MNTGGDNSRNALLKRILSITSVIFLINFPSLNYADSNKENTGESKLSLPITVPRARWSEDWSILSDSEFINEGTPLLFKNITLNSRGDNYLSFGGE